MKERILNIVKNNKRFVSLFICLTIFVFILINVLNGSISVFDTTIYNLISSLKSNFMTVFFRTITRFGDEEVLILIAILCLIFIKNRRIGSSIAVNLASVGLISHIIKEIVQRQRPPIELRMVEESSFSFPSGHAMASMAFYGLIMYFINKNTKSKKIKNISCMILSILIFLIGISRIYLGVHYASDVLAGFMLSAVYLILYITFVLKLMNNKRSI